MTLTEKPTIGQKFYVLKINVIIYLYEYIYLKKKQIV